VVDFRRKVFILKALRGMSKPEKTDSKKFLPTMDIFDVNNAISWYRIRRIARDYGFHMTNRHMVLIPAVFIYMIFIYALNWVKNLNALDFPWARNFMDDVAPILNIDYTIFSFLVIFLLTIVSRFNTFYEDHINALHLIRESIKDLKEFQTHYFGKGKIKSGFFAIQNDFLYHKKISNPVHKFYIARIKSMYPEDQISEVLKQTAKAWGDVMSYLEKEKALLRIEILTFPVNAFLIVRATGLMLISALGGLSYWIESAKSQSQQEQPAQ
jgi:hypothetical protein